MKNRFFILSLLIAGLNFNIQAMEDEATPLKSFINKIQSEGPSNLLAIYIINSNQQLLLGKDNRDDSWSVPMGPMLISDNGLSHGAKRIVSQITTMNIFNLKLCCTSTLSCNLLSLDAETLKHSWVIHHQATKDFSSEPQTPQLDTQNQISFLTSYNSWQWFNKDSLPTNLSPYILRQEDLYNLLKNFRG